MRRWHRLLGLTLSGPFLIWALTGLLFFLKPGWGPAYAPLNVGLYPLRAGTHPTPPGCLESRRLRTVLGEHLLVRDADGWRQLDPVTLDPRPAPQTADVWRLFADAIRSDSTRYGGVVSCDSLRAETTHGKQLWLDWSQLSMSQRGPDTDRIDFLYRLHYLQWTGHPGLDALLGIAGLLGIVGLTALGLLLLRGPPKKG